MIFRIKVKCHIYQGQRSHWPSSNKGPNKGRWAHINVKLLHFSDLPWNQTIMPTLLGHTTQESAGQDVMSKFSPIIEASQTNLLLIIFGTLKILSYQYSRIPPYGSPDQAEIPFVCQKLAGPNAFSCIILSKNPIYNGNPFSRLAGRQFWP